MKWFHFISRLAPSENFVFILANCFTVKLFEQSAKTLLQQKKRKKEKEQKKNQISNFLSWFHSSYTVSIFIKTLWFACNGAKSSDLSNLVGPGLFVERPGRTIFASVASANASDDTSTSHRTKCEFHAKDHSAAWLEQRTDPVCTGFAATVQLRKRCDPNDRTIWPDWSCGRRRSPESNDRMDGFDRAAHSDCGQSDRDRSRTRQDFGATTTDHHRAIHFDHFDRRRPDRRTSTANDGSSITPALRNVVANAVNDRFAVRFALLQMHHAILAKGVQKWQDPSGRTVDGHQTWLENRPNAWTGVQRKGLIRSNPIWLRFIWFTFESRLNWPFFDWKQKQKVQPEEEELTANMEIPEECVTKMDCKLGRLLYKIDYDFNQNNVILLRRSTSFHLL